MSENDSKPKPDGREALDEAIIGLTAKLVAARRENEHLELTVCWLAKRLDQARARIEHLETRKKGKSHD